MDKDYVQIHITGKVGTENLSPSNYDISELKELLDNVCTLFDATNAKNRPVVSLEIHNGSYLSIFKSTTQAVALAGAMFTLVQQNNSLQGLDSRVSDVFVNFQKAARQKDYTFEFTTSLAKAGHKPLVITPITNFRKNEPVWISGEFYFFGTIVDAGGKTNPNIHLDVKNVGVITISSAREYLAGQEKNLLYHECGVRVKGVQNLETGELGNDFELIEITDYSPAFDEEYLNDCIRKASKHLHGVDAEHLLREIRGGNDYV